MSIKSEIERIMDKSLRFHTPGHKGRLDFYDVTELKDGKLFPADSVKRAQKKTAAYYGAKELRYLTQGSSQGIKAAIMSVGGDIIAAANSHPSVYEGASLAGVNIIEVENTERYGLKLPLEGEKIKRAIEKHPSAKAVLLCSPDYYGFCAGEDAVKAVKSAGLKLIADSAHGAHFPFSPYFPRSLASIADFCNLSAHKTLAAYTSTAYLAVNDLSALAKVDHNLKLLGTTSPSYLFLSRLELAADEAAKAEQRYAELYKAVMAFKKKVDCLPNHDFSRLVVKAEGYGLSGYALYDRLAGQKIYAELADESYVVFIVSLCDTAADVEKLEQAVLKCVKV